MLMSHLTLQKLSDSLEVKQAISPDLTCVVAWFPSGSQGLYSKHLKDVQVIHFIPHLPHFQNQHHPCSACITTKKSAWIYWHVLYLHQSLSLFVHHFSSITLVLEGSRGETVVLGGKPVAVVVRD